MTGWLRAFSDSPSLLFNNSTNILMEPTRTKLIGFSHIPTCIFYLLNTSLLIFFLSSVHIELLMQVCYHYQSATLQIQSFCNAVSLVYQIIIWFLQFVILTLISICTSHSLSIDNKTKNNNKTRAMWTFTAEQVVMMRLFSGYILLFTSVLHTSHSPQQFPSVEFILISNPKDADSSSASSHLSCHTVFRRNICIKPVRI